MQRRFVLFSLLFLAGVASIAALVGGWKPIANVNDSHVQEIGKYAVSEYNKRSKADLKFKGVVKGESQVVSGIKYRLVVAVKDATATKNYEAVVWEKAWLNYRNLTSFEPLGH
ncbi:hypothetical protein K2173_017928 [Erythroxylum novogranatense]|uniref:Cystatin domain-containing protein n=1 Tax=Erythroxylum novogranatense TaxID=1862640 RepID=A0AAV8TTV6_9ROSI|nr:hypothetical protein K2173_017928 [Erythroxylum novogranatense]